MPALDIGFYRVPKLWDTTEAIQTRGSRLLLGDVVHTEARFRDGLATSIMNDGTVFLEPRDLRNPKRMFLSLSVTDKQEATMRAFATKAVDAKIGFNTSGFYRCAIPGMSRTCTDTQYFCSEYITRMLQSADLLPGVDAGSCHPTKLFKILAPVCSVAANVRYLSHTPLSVSCMTAQRQ
jgi:hypothetical protein